MKTVASVECTDGKALLFASIPHSRQKDEGRLADTLEDSKQSAHNDKPDKVLASCGASQNRSPRDDTGKMDTSVNVHNCEVDGTHLKPRYFAIGNL